MLLLIMSIEASLICLAQEPLPEGAKKFGEITIPQEVDPQFIKLPASVKGDPSVSVLKIHLYESTRPLRRIVFSQTKFFEVDVDEEILQANMEASIGSLTAGSKGRHSLKKSVFVYPGLKGKRFSIEISGSNAFVYECFQFHNRSSIWWINFIGQGDGEGIADYAETFMRKVSFSARD